MDATLPARTLSISIAAPVEQVYQFVADAENLPQWAAGLCKAVRRAEVGWIVETPHGEATLRFTQPNELGVLDHYISPAPGTEIYVPMRVVSNGSGSEILFTLFRQPKMSDAQFAADADHVERDLHTLKKILER